MYLASVFGKIKFSFDRDVNNLILQAPTSMKSVLQACWLVTTAFGDLIVVILSLSKPVDGVVSFLYNNTLCFLYDNMSSSFKFYFN